MQLPPQLLLVLLLLPPAAPDTCKPVLHVDPLPANGGRTASVSAPPGCRCKKLYLSVRVRHDHRLCDNLQEHDCHWLVLKRTHANYTLVLAGWYRPSGRGCRYGDGRVVKPSHGAHRCVPGLRLHAWNVTLSSVPQPDRRLSVSVVRQFGAGADAGPVFFRQLEVRLIRLTDIRRITERHHVNCSDCTGGVPAVAAAGCCPLLEFGESKGLQPGRYEVDVLPLDVFSCSGDHCKRSQSVEVPARYMPKPAPIGPPSRGLQPLFLLTAVPAVLLVLGAAACWLRCRRAPRDCPSADAGTVLLLPANSQAPQLDTIKAHLRRLGVGARDFQEREVFNAFHSRACVSAALELPALREARLVFVCAGPDAPPLRPAAAQVWDSVLRHVRNRRPTELLVVTAAGGPGPEASGLAAARAFAAPGDLDALVRHLRETAARNRPPSGLGAAAV